MGRTKQTLRNRPSSPPPRKMFPYPGARAEALMGNDVRLIDQDVHDCVAYHDVIHPVVIRRILDNGKIECEVNAFSEDKNWFVDVFEAKHIYKPRASEPIAFQQNTPIEFLCSTREEDNGESVWIRGWMIDKKNDLFKIRHFDWNTKEYEATTWVDAKLCRSCLNAPGKY